MRISTLQSYTQGVNGIKNASEQSFKTQNQLSIGKRVLTPSDDPVASTRIVQLNQAQAIRDQYKSNIGRVSGRLDLEDAQLGAMNEIITRVRELTIQAGNGAYTKSDREAIAVEMEQRLDELADLMNSKDAGGEYIFSGFKGQTEPFVKNDGGAYVYQGDEGRRYVTIAEGATVAVSDSGKSAFENVVSAENTFYTKAGVNNTSNPPATISQGIVVDQDAYDAFYPDDMAVTFYASARGLEYLVSSKTDGRVLADGASNANAYGSGESITVSGISFTINGTPAVTDSFSVESSSKQGLLTTIGKLVEGLRTLDNDNPDALQHMLDTSLGNLDNAETRLLQVRADVGARMNTLDSTLALHEQLQVASDSILSDLQDLDFAEATSRLQFQTFILEAAQQSYIKVQNLSLFNFLG